MAEGQVVAKLRHADRVLQDGQDGPGLLKEASKISSSGSEDTYIPDVAEVGPMLRVFLVARPRKGSRPRQGLQSASLPLPHVSQWMCMSGWLRFSF
jgi:hypothetical protein